MSCFQDTPNTKYHITMATALNILNNVLNHPHANLLTAIHSLCALSQSQVSAQRQIGHAVSITATHCKFAHNYAFGHKLKMAFIGVLLTGMIGLTPVTPAHAIITVVDPSLIRENVMQRVLSIEQWARDNLNQLEQITRLDTGNEILNSTQQLMTQNYAMDFKESWQQVKHLQEESLTLLHAAKAMWEEFGSSQQYYAAFHKAKAWEKCMQHKHCTFATALNELHDKSISQAIQAYHNAEDMNAKLQTQIEQLQQLNIESQESTSAAGTLDAMSKINGHVASSMVDLNNQIAQLTKLQSHEMAQQNNEALAHDSYIRAITDFSDEIHERPIPYQLP